MDFHLMHSIYSIDEQKIATPVFLSNNAELTSIDGFKYLWHVTSNEGRCSFYYLRYRLAIVYTAKHLFIYLFRNSACNNTTAKL